MVAVVVTEERRRATVPRRMARDQTAAPLPTSLLRDYTAPCVPNTPYTVLRGHTDGVKSVAWLPSAHNGYEGGGSAPLLLSAGNDMTVRLWSARDGQCLAALDGHTARVWQLAVSKTGQLVASAAADGTVRLWRVGDATTEAWAAEASSNAVNGRWWWR